MTIRFIFPIHVGVGVKSSIVALKIPAKKTGGINPP
jgi:hypothetical protein